MFKFQIDKLGESPLSFVVDRNVYQILLSNCDFELNVNMENQISKLETYTLPTKWIGNSAAGTFSNKLFFEYQMKLIICF